jgi:biotin transport system substrate-specific component
MGLSHLSLSLGRPTLADRLIGRGLAPDILLILTGAAFTSIAAQVSTPAWPIQMTGQSLAVILVGMTLGSLRGAISMTLYVLGGSWGLPIFSNSASGLETITGPAGGYVIGFIAAAAFVGVLAERGLDRTFLRAVGSAAAGTVIIFLAGVPRLAVVSDLSIGEAVAQGFLPLAAGGVVKLLMAAAINSAAWSAVNRMEVRDAERSGSVA